MNHASRETAGGHAGATIQINAIKYPDGKVTVTPLDQDVFLLTVQEVINACHAARGDGLALQKFELLLRRLGAWVIEMGPAVREAYLTRRDGGLCFLVIKSEPLYDREFEDALSELYLGLTREHELFPFDLEVMSLPPAPEESLRSFLGSSTLEFRSSDVRAPSERGPLSA
ncbi:MAG: hypothetical protein IPN34_19120 [Planctomycetes bacterium]|nr:hypothetical protein [Planctomycetota bacterium]